MTLQSEIKTQAEQEAEDAYEAERWAAYQQAQAEADAKAREEDPDWMSAEMGFGIDWTMAADRAVKAVYAAIAKASSGEEWMATYRPSTDTYYAVARSNWSTGKHGQAFYGTKGGWSKHGFTTPKLLQRYAEQDAKRAQMGS